MIMLPEVMLDSSAQIWDIGSYPTPLQQRRVDDIKCSPQQLELVSSKSLNDWYTCRRTSTWMNNPFPAFIDLFLVTETITEKCIIPCTGHHVQCSTNTTKCRRTRGRSRISRDPERRPSHRRPYCCSRPDCCRPPDFHSTGFRRHCTESLKVNWNEENICFYFEGKFTVNLVIQ